MMNFTNKAVAGFMFCVSFGLATQCMAAAAPLQESQAAAAPQAATRQIGTVKALSGNTITLKTDSGAEINVLIQESTRLLRVAPGENLKSATPIQFSDVQVGDRMLVRGSAGGNAQELAASTVVVMKQSDVAQKQEQEREAWQRHGVGGIVRAVDASSDTVTIAITPTYTVKIQTTKSTGFLRYAPDSVKFNDAKPGTFDQIKIGDQLRARGTASADGKEFAADQIISGTFRNIAGTVVSTDAGANSIHVMDLLAKGPVVVKITPDSQLRKLPPQMAQRIAFMLKGSASPQAGAGQRGNPGQRPTGDAQPASPNPSRPGGAPDFQQMVSRLPAVTVADLQKGDAVMIVSTPDVGAGGVTAITLLSGVEPILSAAPNGSGAAALLSTWNMSSGEGEGPSQ